MHEASDSPGLTGLLGGRRWRGIAIGVLALLVPAGLLSCLAMSGGPGPPFGWHFVANIGALLALLGGVVGAVSVARHEADSESMVAATIVATAALVPITVAEVGTVFAYILPTLASADWRWIHDYAVAVGAIPALYIWGVLGFLLRDTACAAKQDTDSYAQLMQRLDTVDARLAAYCPHTGDGEQSKDKALACQEATNQRESIRRDLGMHGLRWVLATGYIAAWQRVHRVEEALYLLESPAAVAAEVEFDISRLRDSQIEQADVLIGRLEDCLTVLRGAAGTVAAAGQQAAPVSTAGSSTGAV